MDLMPHRNEYVEGLSLDLDMIGDDMCAGVVSMTAVAQEAQTEGEVQP